MVTRLPSLFCHGHIARPYPLSPATILNPASPATIGRLAPAHVPKSGKSTVEKTSRAARPRYLTLVGAKDVPNSDGDHSSGNVSVSHHPVSTRS